MKNPGKITPEVMNEEQRKSSIMRELYVVYLLDREVSLMSFLVSCACDLYLTDKERGEIEKSIFGKTCEEMKKEFLEE